MNRNILGMYRCGVVMITALVMVACQGKYRVVDAEGEQLIVDAHWDAKVTDHAVAMLSPFKHQIDSMMSYVLGESEVDMDRVRPESELPNLVADLLREAAREVIGRKADVGIINMGGVRTTLAKGPITMANVYEILPFENALCVLTFKGDVLQRAMEEIARRGGEGLSGVRMFIGPKKELKRVEVNGQPIRPEATYTVATVDYVAQGNDGMPSFAQYEESIFCPERTMRNLFKEHVERCTAHGKKVTSRVEGRVVREKVVEMGLGAPSTQTLLFLHTSDTHSRMEPVSLSAAGSDAGCGGVVRRAALVDSMRTVDPELLLVDCGDISQGTPYYNLFRGDAEIAAMNEIGYDAMTIGNHEFDFGVENMARVFKQAHFPVVCANYGFEGTPLEGIVKPYTVVERKGMRIGIFGLSPKMAGLVPTDKCEGVTFINPIEAARQTVDILRGQERCDVVVCLSHLGLKGMLGGDDDEPLLAKTHGIDVVFGGHTHTLMPEPKSYLNDQGGTVYLFHSGSRGTSVGKLTLTLQCD